MSNKEPQSINFVAELDGKIVGFCSIGPSRDEDASEKTGKIYAIYIDKENSSKGIGTKLLREGLDNLKKLGFTNATLWVLKSNTKGRKFYEKNGWIHDGKTKIDKRNDVIFDEVRYAINLIL